MQVRRRITSTILIGIKIPNSSVVGYKVIKDKDYIIQNSAGAQYSTNIRVIFTDDGTAVSPNPKNNTNWLGEARVAGGRSEIVTAKGQWMFIIEDTLNGATNLFFDEYPTHNKLRSPICVGLDGPYNSDGTPSPSDGSTTPSPSVGGDGDLDAEDKFMRDCDITRGEIAFAYYDNKDRKGTWVQRSSLHRS